MPERDEKTVSSPRQTWVTTPRWWFQSPAWRGTLFRTALVMVTFGLFLLTWQAYVMLTETPAVILPAPVGIGAALLELYPQLLADAGITAATAVLGLFFGAVVGVGLGFGMVVSRSVSRTFVPYIVALRIAPLIAIAPLLFLWFGRGLLARSVLVATLTVFPLTIATLDGLRSTPPSYLSLMQSVDASAWRVFLNVRVPAAAPSIFAGFKIAATLSVIGAVGAEFLTLQAGIGYRVFRAATFLETTESFAALVVLAILGNLFYLVPVAVERVLWTNP